MYSINIPENILVPFIKEGVLSDSRITFFYGWRDGGKSTSIAKMLIFKCLFDDHFRCAHIRSKYNEIYLSTYGNLVQQIKQMGLTDYFIFIKDHFMIINKLRPSNFFFGASGDSPDKIRSTHDLSCIWFEEFHDCTEEIYGSIQGSIRTKIGFKPKFIASFNNDKVAPDSFIAQTFFNPESAMYDRVERIFITHKNNPHIDQAETELKLIDVCLGDMDKYARLSEGEFIEEVNKTAWLYVDWSDRLINTHIPTIEGNTIYLSFDINNEPITCTAWQFSSGHHAPHGEGHFLRPIAEFEASMVDTEVEIIQHICQKIKSAFPYHPLRMTGDANGRNRLKGVSGNKSVYTLVSGYLNISDQLIDVPNINMELEISWKLCNTFAYNHRTFQISTVNTPKLARDMKNAKALPTDDPKKTHHILKDRELNKNDYFDTFRYIIHTYFNYFLRN